MKAYIRIARTPLPTFIDTRVSICIILEDFAKKLRLKIEANDGTKVAPLGGESKIKIIGFISNTSIAVQNLRMSELLYIIGGTESVVILGIDWMD